MKPTISFIFDENVLFLLKLVVSLTFVFLRSKFESLLTRTSMFKNTEEEEEIYGKTLRCFLTAGRESKSENCREIFSQKYALPYTVVLTEGPRDRHLFADVLQKTITNEFLS